MRSPARLLLLFDPLQDANPPSPATSIDSEAVVVVSLLLCAIICVIGLALVAHCAWLRRSLSANPSSAAPTLRKGIKKKVLRSLPTLSFVSFVSSSSSAPADATVAGPCGVELVDCAICLAEFADGDEVRILPQCGHGFHAACVDKWLGAHSSCPSCRRILVVSAPPQRSQPCGGSSGGGSSGGGPAKSTESGGASTSKNSG